MSDFSNFLNDIRTWSARRDWSDATVTSFVRMAETTLSQSLRVGEMIKSTPFILSVSSFALPADWLESEDVYWADGSGQLSYMATPDFNAGLAGFNNYTVVGRTVKFAATPSVSSPKTVSMDYWASIPQFIEATNWMHTKFYNIFLQASLAAAALYAEEYDRAATIENLVSALVASANDTYSRGKHSGSTLKMRLNKSRRIG